MVFWQFVILNFINWIQLIQKNSDLLHFLSSFLSSSFFFFPFSWLSLILIILKISIVIILNNLTKRRISGNFVYIIIDIPFTGKNSETPDIIWSLQHTCWHKSFLNSWIIVVVVRTANVLWLIYKHLNYCSFINSWIIVVVVRTADVL